MTAEEVVLADEAATNALGARLAGEISPGDVVLLAGDLGAGKSALARAIIRALLDDLALEVPSPSFSLVQPYDGRGLSILHADLYRLAGARDIADLGLLEDEQAIVLVEWPERTPALFDMARMVVRLRLGPGGAGRIATIERR